MRYLNFVERFSGTVVSDIPGATSVYRSIRDFLIWKHRLTAGEKWIEYNGIKLYADTSDFVAQSLSLRGCYEPETTRLLKRHLNEGDFAVDIGGNIGHHTTTMRQRVGEDGMVWVFEPNEKNAGYIKKTLSQNRWKNVELFPVALSDANSTDQLMITNSRNTGSAVLSDLCSEEGEDEVVQEKHTVGTKSLSRLLNERDKKRIDLLKIDVEGAEKNIISDLEDDLHKVETIILEFHSDRLSENQIQKTFQILNAHGEITDTDGYAVKLEQLIQEKMKVVWQAK